MPAAVVDSQIGVVRSVKALRARVDGWRAAGETVGLVPTMGALHEGHLSLVRRSNSLARRTVASIFVNPRQFAPHEDFGSYPRQEAHDLELLQKAGCHLAYIPPPEEMYPDGFQTSIAVSEIAQGLCGGSRPHFFGGVATVVCKLINQARPDIAVFGEKDYQQLLVIRRMVKDLNMPVDIIGAPIVREADGLAMSSRNAYLSSEERAIAGRLNAVLADMAAKLSAGAEVAATIDDGRAAINAAGFAALDYLEVRSADLLEPMGPGAITRPSRVFAAVIVGKTRLIDNWPAEPPAA
ncbi:MAG: pantoate--beta-alanine ligase [Parvularculaceae bacterium]|nr:pantoate--beta-alanine ligase [Parvularculaceae bacterium]